jgi:hypothetical protein
MAIFIEFVHLIIPVATIHRCSAASGIQRFLRGRTGVFRDERGYGAFVRAQPTGTMFFVRSGARVFNGEVMRIGGDASDPGNAKVVFREVSYTELNGKQTPQEHMVTKLPGEKK